MIYGTFTLQHQIITGQQEFFNSIIILWDHHHIHSLLLMKTFLYCARLSLVVFHLKEDLDSISIIPCGGIRANNSLRIYKCLLDVSSVAGTVLSQETNMNTRRSCLKGLGVYWLTETQAAMMQHDSWDVSCVKEE